MKVTRATDIMEIAKRLDGHVDFQEIKFDQILPADHGYSINDLLFVDHKFGVYFYTSASALEGLCTLSSDKLPTLVTYKGSQNVYRIR